MSWIWVHAEKYRFSLSTRMTNLQTVMDKESKYSLSPTSEVADEIMEEACRMTMAVGSSRRGDNVREIN